MEAISRSCVPAAAARTKRQRKATCCGVLGTASHRTTCARSSTDKLTSGLILAMRTYISYSSQYVYLFMIHTTRHLNQLRSTWGMNTMIFVKRILLFSLITIPASLLAQAPPVQSKYKPEYFTFQKVMIPMRDDVRLQTVIQRPKNAVGPLPMLFARTPYGVPEDSNSLTESGLFDDLIADGYIFVSQNIRGRFKSEGTFIMQRPPRDKNDSKSVDECTDAYDTIFWLLKNLPDNNGRVGMWGISYPGWLVTQALLDPHPALKAASEQASPDDMFINDDLHPNGAFRLS